MNQNLAASIRESWERGKPWVAVGVLATVTIVFFALYMEYRGAHRGIAEQRGTGLGAVAGMPDPISMWQIQHGRVPAASMAMVAYQPDRQIDDNTPSSARLIVRTGKLRIVASNPAMAVDHIARLAADASGFVASSAIAGSGNQQAAQIVVRVPAASLDKVRRQVRTLAVDVVADSVESHDVTREYTDQRATLLNLRATEDQYRALVQRATRMEDVTAITEKLSEVRGEIDKLEAELRLLQSQVDMSSLTVDIDPLIVAAPLLWKPVLRLRENWHSVASSFMDYGDAMIALLMHIPVIVLWMGTIVLAGKLLWFVIKRALRLLFPGFSFSPNDLKPAQ